MLRVQPPHRLHRLRGGAPGRRPLVIGTASLAAVALALGASSIASAHVEETAGTYHLLIGWHQEPVYVDQPDAVELTVTDSAGKPVNDLGATDVQVTVGTGGQTSSPLSFDPAFDLTEGTGVQGQYVAGIVPTAPGDYTFHLTGAIHGTKVDVSVTSGDETFNAVVGTSDLEFPNKLPTMDEVATHLDRIDGRIAALQSAAPGGGATDPSAASNAESTANQALYLGGGLGLLALVVAVVALVIGLRATRRSS